MMLIIIIVFLAPDRSLLLKAIKEKVRIICLVLQLDLINKW